MDVVEQEGLKGGDDEKKRSVGRNNKEYRDFRRQSIKGQAASPQRGRQGSIFQQLSPQERPSRPTPKGAHTAAPPAQKKKPKEAVGKYLLGDALGRGQFGLVFKGIDSENGAIVAIKQLKSNQLSEDSLQAFEAEISLLSKLDHATVVRYLDCVRTKDHVNLVIEYCDGGALTSIFKKFGKFPEKLCALYTYQCLQGLEYLHSQGVVHRDIKCANILLTKSGKVKLADFGISTTANSPDGPDSGVGFGSPYWMAPEVIEMEVVPNEKADIWSLGCTVIEILTGNPPYHEYHPMGAIVKCIQDEHPPFPSNISKDMEDFLLKCFQKDREKRASAKELLGHPWFNSLLREGGEKSGSTDRLDDVKPEKQPENKLPDLQEADPVPKLEPPRADRVSSQTLSTLNLSTLRNISTDSNSLPRGATVGLGSRQIRVNGESIRKDSPSKAVYITSATTAEELVQVLLAKYNSEDEPGKYAIFVDDVASGESKQLEGSDLLMPIAEKDEENYRFAVRPATEPFSRKDGLLLRKRNKRGLFMKATVPVRVLLDLDERFLAYYRGDRPSNEMEDPIEVVYNLRMLRGVKIAASDPASRKFEFSVGVRGEVHTFRAASQEDMEGWVNALKRAISIARPLHLGTSSSNLRPGQKKGRESKVMDANELMVHRPRFSSGRSIQSVPESPEAHQEPSS